MICVRAIVGVVTTRVWKIGVFLKNNQVMLNLFQHPIRKVIRFTDIS
jgi:hypothetical protein